MYLYSYIQETKDQRLDTIKEIRDYSQTIDC